MKSAAAAGIDNTTRKKWDKQEYKEKALQRVNAEEGDKQKNDRNNKLKASDFGLVVKQPLSRENMIERDFKRDLLSKVGTVTLVNPVTKEGSGFMCKETGVILHDSISYLDHINSKKTQRERGISIHAERSTVEQVRNRFQMHKKRKEQIKRGEKPDGEEETDLVKRIEHATNKEREEQEERKERKRLKKEQKKLGMNKEEVEKTLEEDEMTKAMGFSGFQ
jgi:U4/U6.U5 tri-snRNP component SNU23